MEAICQSQKIKYIFNNSNFTILKNNKMVYSGAIENVIVLHVNCLEKSNQILWILYFIDQSKKFIGYFDKADYSDGVQLIECIKNNCSFLGLTRFQAESYVYRQKNPSFSNANSDCSVISQENANISKHDLKRDKVIQKIQDQKLIVFDVMRGLIHDHVHHTLPNIKNPTVLLHSGEICHYCANVELEVTKNMVVGSVGRSVGLKSRFSNSSIYTGNNVRQSVRADITEHFKGVLFITNRRVVFQSEKTGFDIDLKKLSNVIEKLTYVVLQCGKEAYKIITSFPVLISEIIYVASENI